MTDQKQLVVSCSEFPLRKIRNGHSTVGIAMRCESEAVSSRELRLRGGW